MATPPLDIRPIVPDEFRLLWPIFQAEVEAGETYAYPADIGYEEARDLWTRPPARCWVASLDGAVVGGYFVRPSQIGRGDHVANAGYLVAAAARGRGIGGALCEHSMEVARQAGFQAMQFNFVVVTNEGAVRLWQRHGFAIVGRVPEAFRHPRHGLTDVFVMYRRL